MKASVIAALKGGGGRPCLHRTWTRLGTLLADDLTFVDATGKAWIQVG
jgi:hypothetical protein